MKFLKTTLNTAAQLCLHLHCPLSPFDLFGSKEKFENLLGSPLPPHPTLRGKEIKSVGRASTFKRICTYLKKLKKL